MFIFCYDTFSVGGAETMMARMCKWAISRGEKAFIFCRDKKGDKVWIDNLLKDSCTGLVIDCNLDAKRIIRFIREERCNDETVFFCTMSVFPCREFVYMIQLARKINKIKFINFSITSIEKKGGRLDSIVNKLFSSFLKVLLNNHVLIGMVDYQSVEKTYGIKFKKKSCFHLPMFREEFIKPQKLKKDGTFNILTVSRADFPFKGYLLGLVDIFEKLSKEYDNIKLTIVSYGKDIDLLENAIKKCDNGVKKNIKLIGPLGYMDIKKEIAETSIYIGMGTTILDAAKFGKPCIVVETFSNGIDNAFMWHNNYDFLCADGIAGRSGEYLLKKMIEMPNELYENVSRKTYDKFLYYYAIEKVMPKICMYASQQNKLIYNPIRYYAIWFVYRLKGRINGMFS